MILPAGLLLGAIGGHYARPEMVRSLDDGSLQFAFETRAQRYGTAAEPAPEDPAYDSGGYSYPPYLDDRMLGGDREITGWQGPSFADWPEYKTSPTPSIAQLEAQVAARDAALGQRAWGSAETDGDDRSPAEYAAQAAADAAANAADDARSAQPDGTESGPKVVIMPHAVANAALSAEPQSPDSDLPAIW